MNIVLTRFAYSHMGVFGKLFVPGKEEDFEAFECFTVERPWLGNKPFESCIPIGEYSIVLGRFNRGGYPAYEVTDVPGRSLIKIHRGNTMNDLLGCIAPGLALGCINGVWAVTNSREAFSSFMEAMDGKRVASLKITNLEAG